MCGLLGVSSPKDVNVNVEDIKLLYLANETRGGHSCGFTTGSDVTKEAVNSYDFLSKDNLPESISTFVGHTRYATFGSRVDKNAHPFKIDNLVGAHNGTIRNFDMLQSVFDTAYDVDSEFIYYLLNTYGLRKTLPLFQGTMALTWIENNDRTIHIYRSGRPLFYGMKGDSMFYSSEERFLTLIECTDVKEFQEHTYYQLKNGRIAYCRQLPKAILPFPPDKTYKTRVTYDILKRETHFKALKDKKVDEAIAALKAKKKEIEDRKLKTGKTVYQQADAVGESVWRPSEAVSIPQNADCMLNDNDELVFYWVNQYNIDIVCFYTWGDKRVETFNISTALDTQKMLAIYQTIGELAIEECDALRQHSEEIERMVYENG